MDKKIRDELTQDGVKPAHIGDGFATVADLEANGIGPQDVSQETAAEVFSELDAQTAQTGDVGEDY